MSVANTALLYNLGLDGHGVADGLTAGAAAVRASALRLPDGVNRVVSGPANGACVLPSIVSGEATVIIFVINDSAQTIKVGAAPGETVNGVATATDMSAGILAIPSGQSGIFVPIPNSKGGTLDWRSSVIP